MGHSPAGGGSTPGSGPRIGRSSFGGPLVQGLVHLHRTLGYALVFLALANVAGALSVRHSAAHVGRIVGRSVRFGVLLGGRFVLLIGAGLFVAEGLPWSEWWLWVTVVLWAVVELAARRMIFPETELLELGSGTLRPVVVGTTIQLLAIVGIFVLMKVRS